MILFKPYNSPYLHTLATIKGIAHISMSLSYTCLSIILLTYLLPQMQEGPQKPKRRSQEQKQEPPEVERTMLLDEIRKLQDVLFARLRACT